MNKYLKNGSNNNLIEEKLSCDNKVNLKYLNKNSTYNSNSNFQNIICNQFNRTLITGINQISELSTKNSTTKSLKDKNIKLKKRMGINIEKINENIIDEIYENKNKPFEALENLLIYDEINDINNYINNKENNNIKNDSNNSISLNDTQNINTYKLKKEKKCVSVPKLDFSVINNKYKNSKLIIKEVKNISKHYHSKNRN